MFIVPDEDFYTQEGIATRGQNANVTMLSSKHHTIDLLQL